MNDYPFVDDCRLVEKLLGIPYSDLAYEIGISPAAFSRLENYNDKPNRTTLESLYSFAYSNKKKPLRLNKLKAEFHMESGKPIFFHGSKSGIEGPISPNFGRKTSDFGEGFYCGESYEQAATFIAPFREGSVYVVSSDENDMNIARFKVDEEWMLAVAFYRGRLDEYAGNERILAIRKKVEEADVVIAPIADNAMYETMMQFCDGDITSTQAVHCLSASNLGMQHVYKSSKACSSLEVLERLYLCEKEKADWNDARKQRVLVSYDKVKMAKEKFRRQGKYIEELLNG